MEQSRKEKLAEKIKKLKEAISKLKNKHEIDEARIMDRDALVNAYYVSSTGDRHKVAEGIPYYLLDKLVPLLTKKYAITMNDIEVRPADKTQYRRSSQPELAEEQLDEFAPDEGHEPRKFIPWTEFIEQLKQVVGKDFDCVENVVKTTIKARFVPHDPMEYGPTMLYSYYETRAGGRNKGAISTRGSIQVGKYTEGGITGQAKGKLLTTFSLLKGHPFERHFDLTFDNIYKVANIILGNTQGALEFKPELAEGVEIAQPGQLVKIIQAPRNLDLLPGETFEVRSSNEQGVTLKHGMGTKFDNVIFPHGTYKIINAQGLREFAPTDGGDNRVPMHFIIEKELYNPRSKWKKSYKPEGGGVLLFTTKEEAIQAAEKFNRIDKNREFKYGGTQMADSDLDEGIFGGLGGPASGPMLAKGGPGYAGLSGAKKLRHDADVALKMVASLKHTNHNGYYDEEIKKKLLQAQECLAKAKEIEQGLSEDSELPVNVHKSPYEGSDDELRYTTMFKASPNSSQRFAKHIISQGGKARIGKRGQDYYVYHNTPISKEEWRKSETQGVDETKVSKYKDLGATKDTTHFIKNVTTGEIVSPHRSKQDAEDALVAHYRGPRDGNEYKIVRARKDVEEGLKGKLAAAALGAGMAASAPGAAISVAGAIPTPSHQAAMYKAAADSNRAEAKRQAELQKKADAERLEKNTEIVDKEQRKNHHLIPTNEDYLDE